MKVAVRHNSKMQHHEQTYGFPRQEAHSVVVGASVEMRCMCRGRGSVIHVGHQMGHELGMEASVKRQISSGRPQKR
jgi:hypothetical protein